MVMNCSYHNDKPAVGICKNCQRGLCPECAVETPSGLACPERCEHMVLLLDKLVQQSGKARGVAGTSFIALGLAVGLVGVVFAYIAPGLFQHVPGVRLLSVPFLAIALICILNGLFYFKK